MGFMCMSKRDPTVGGWWYGWRYGVVAAATMLLVAADGPGDEKSPFFPSAQTTPDGKTVPLKKYAKNSDCTECHKAIGKQWHGSMHAAALTDPVFRALYEIGSKETNGLTDKLCIGCHSSPAVISGHSAPKEIAKLGPPASEGVSCVVCHSITGSNLTSPDQLPANASFITDPKGPIVTPHTDRPCRQPGSVSKKSEMLRKSEFCANCHGVVHPLNGFVIERTFEEWRASIYAAKGFQCQDCHMQPVEKAIRAARTLQRIPNPGRVTEKSPVRRHVYTHNFVGGNIVVTGLLGAEKHAAMATKLLQSAASLDLSLPATAAPSEAVQLRVKVNNETAGHNLPTSLVEVRQMWLDIQVTDAAGNEVFRSGAVGKNGDIDPDAVMFHATAVDVAGKPTVKPWEMTRFVYFHTVPPKGYTLERYAFRVPPTAKGPLKVKASLRYRSFPQSVANLLLGKDAPTIPIVDMTSTVKTLRLQKRTVPKKRAMGRADQLPSGITRQGRKYICETDGMELVLVPGGTFRMGSSQGSFDERPVHEVHLDPFLIDIHEVTNAQFDAFVTASGYRPKGPWKRGYGPGEGEHPVRFVTWYDARAYANWAGRSLPTEAMWEKAARGESNFVYPWGMRWQAGMARVDLDVSAGPCRVGSFRQGASPYGCLDMGGNVWEWVNDWYDRYYYQSFKENELVRNPNGPEDEAPPESRFIKTGTAGGNERSTRKVIRGGGWVKSGKDNARCSKRSWGNPRYWFNDTGFRCAVALPAATD